MAARVVTVRREAKLTWVERLYLPMILKALWVTSRHFFRNLIGFARGQSRAFVVQYPEERVDFPDAFRGMPVLVADEEHQPRCVACGLCEFACPTDCITIQSGELEGSRTERYPLSFQIDMSRCMVCGLCEEACPEEAFVMSREVEIAAFDRESLVFEKEQLLVPESMLERRLTFLRSEYGRVHETASSETGAPAGREEGASAS